MIVRRDLVDLAATPLAHSSNTTSSPPSATPTRPDRCNPSTDTSDDDAGLTEGDSVHAHSAAQR